MSVKMKTMIERIQTYHAQEEPGDGRGGKLSILEMQEVLPGIVAVRDSLGEVDLFVDVSQCRVNENAKSPYHLFVSAVYEAFPNYRDMIDSYGMVCIVEDRWHPFFARRRATFEVAREAAEQLFQPITGSK